ncbi:TetR/AcrR family transcriptional regulator [Streptomyces sp. NBC_00377]|uniref:TetR/AcrR family transcriptional regulator n=1 Tax=unclassified Streptomyces TaxID=2593676 RepID=UPI002E1E3720|nr:MULTISPECIES: TetR/AcrR family transcriptional regulator [unclassified Streptomyces]
MPKLWNETIEAHRRAVRDAILNTTAELAAEHGVRSVTMSQIAEQAGIGRATLYKYFSDVETILLAWHDRQITEHLGQLAEVRDQVDGAAEKLEAVLRTFAHISRHTRGRHGTELGAFLHGDERVDRAERQLHDMIRELLAQGAEDGSCRDDVTPDELATYCLHALTAAAALPSEAATDRLVTVILSGLRTGPSVPDDRRQKDRHGHHDGHRHPGH